MSSAVNSTRVAFLPQEGHSSWTSPVPAGADSFVDAVCNGAERRNISCLLQFIGNDFKSLHPIELDSYLSDWIVRLVFLLSLHSPRKDRVGNRTPPRCQAKPIRLCRGEGSELQVCREKRGPSSDSSRSWLLRFQLISSCLSMPARRLPWSVFGAAPTILPLLTTLL